MELKSFIVLYNGKFIRVYKEDEADKVIADKDAEIASLNREIAKIQDKMCEDVFEGIMPSEHIVCRPLQQAAEYIAELKAQKAQAEDDRAFWKTKAQRERHHKFKRCLDKARLCKSEEKRLEAISPIFDTNKECWEYGSDYWARWHKRWLELAEQFNPNPTATKENSNG